jgi:hypothetical protein
MILLGLVVAQTNQTKCSGPSAAGSSFDIERESDSNIDFLSVQVVENVLQRLSFD